MMCIRIRVSALILVLAVVSGCGGDRVDCKVLYREINLWADNPPTESEMSDEEFMEKTTWMSDSFRQYCAPYYRNEGDFGGRSAPGVLPQR